MNNKTIQFFDAKQNIVYIINKNARVLEQLDKNYDKIIKLNPIRMFISGYHARVQSRSKLCQNKTVDIFYKKIQYVCLCAISLALWLAHIRKIVIDYLFCRLGCNEDRARNAFFGKCNHVLQAVVISVENKTLYLSTLLKKLLVFVARWRFTFVTGNTIMVIFLKIATYLALKANK